LEQLPNDPAILKHLLLEVLATLHEERRDKEQMRHRIELLLRRLYGPRTERFDPSQPSLFADPASTPVSAPPVSPDPEPAEPPAAEDEAGESATAPLQAAWPPASAGEPAASPVPSRADRGGAPLRV